MNKRIQEDSAEYDMQFYMRKCDELQAEVERLQRELESKQLIHVGFTNNNQINYAKDEEGAFYPDTDNDCWIPLYMLAIHAHRCGYDSETFCRLTQLAQERDQLKAAVALAIGTFRRYDMDVETYPTIEHVSMMRNLKGVLAAHDAEVIEQMLSNMLYEKGMTASHYKCVELVNWMREYANKLRQQAQSESPLKDSQ